MRKSYCERLLVHIFMCLYKTTKDISLNPCCALLIVFNPKIKRERERTNRTIRNVSPAPSVAYIEKPSK